LYYITKLLKFTDGFLSLNQQSEYKVIYELICWMSNLQTP